MGFILELCPLYTVKLTFSPPPQRTLPQPSSPHTQWGLLLVGCYYTLSHFYLYSLYLRKYGKIYLFLFNLKKKVVHKSLFGYLVLRFIMWWYVSVVTYSIVQITAVYLCIRQLLDIWLLPVFDDFCSKAAMNMHS